MVPARSEKLVEFSAEAKAVSSLNHRQKQVHKHAQYLHMTKISIVLDFMMQVKASCSGGQASRIVTAGQTVAAPVASHRFGSLYLDRARASFYLFYLDREWHAELKADRSGDMHCAVFLGASWGAAHLFVPHTAPDRGPSRGSQRPYPKRKSSQ